MKEKLIWSPTKDWCFRADLIGGFKIKSGSDSHCVTVQVLDLDGHVFHELQWWYGFGNTNDSVRALAKKWMEDSGAILQSFDIEIAVEGKNKPTRMIRLDDDEPDGGGG